MFPIESNLQMEAFCLPLPPTDPFLKVHGEFLKGLFHRQPLLPTFGLFSLLLRPIEDC